MKCEIQLLLLLVSTLEKNDLCIVDYDKQSSWNKMSQ